MRVRVSPGPSGVLRRQLAIMASYGAQGLGYAAVMTALPSFQDRWGFGELAVSLIMLASSVMAVTGSLLANAIAIRRGTKVSLTLALLVQAAMLGLAVAAPSFAVFVVAMLCYGVGLGLMDVSENAQAVLLEHDAGRPMMGKFYATYTTAAIVGALLMSAFLASDGAVLGALVVAALVDVAVLILVSMWLARRAGDAAVDASADVPRDRGSLPPLPVGRIVGIGAVVLAAYMLDSAVSSWSTIYLAQGLGAAASVAPLGYAAYQGAVLVARLSTDAVERRLGRPRLGLVAMLAGIVGCLSVATVHSEVGAIVGFCVMGLAVGALVPISFSAAGTLLPARRDEVIARVNLFSYGGSVAGAVVLGVVASGPSLGPAFLIPGVSMVAFLPLMRLFRGSSAGAAGGRTEAGS